MITFDSLKNREEKIAVVGLGYVGLPLAVHLSRHFDLIGYDADGKRVQELKSGYDRTMEVSVDGLRDAKVMYTDDPQSLHRSRLIIVAVPTPVDSQKSPDLGPLVRASTAVGKELVAGSCVVYESTVYPGVTEEICVPILEKASGLKLGVDFCVGYSPERINPGDKTHTLDKIVKIVSGSNDHATELLASVYGKITEAGIHKATSIKVAEAAKVIENTQRDLNIALMNELAIIFHRMNIDTTEVLKAAGTKWNFLPFRPGLVGGHCIGVDPYYLTFRAQAFGYYPEIILAGRRINDGMGKYIAEWTVKMLIRAGKQIQGAKVNILGLTFKEDIPDIRNTKVVDIISELRDYGIEVRIHDPLANKGDVLDHHNLVIQEMDELAGADAVIVAVNHRCYKQLGLSHIAGLCRDGCRPIIMDVKGTFDDVAANEKGIDYWRL